MVWILPHKRRIHKERYLRSRIDKTAFTEQTKSNSIRTHKDKKVKTIKEARPTLSNAEHRQHPKSPAWLLTLKPSQLIPFIRNKPGQKRHPHADRATNPRLIRRTHLIPTKVRSRVGLKLWVRGSFWEVREGGEFQHVEDWYLWGEWGAVFC